MVKTEAYHEAKGTGDFGSCTVLGIWDQKWGTETWAISCYHELEEKKDPAHIEHPGRKNSKHESCGLGSLLTATQCLPDSEQWVRKEGMEDRVGAVLEGGHAVGRR